MAFAHDNKQIADAPRTVPDPGNGGTSRIMVPDLGKDAELKAYRDMLLIRRFEEKAGQMYGMGLIGGFCHLIGQEAVVVGMQTRPHRATRSSPAIAITATCSPAAWTPRASWPNSPAPRRLFQGQGRLDAHVQRREGFYGGHGIVGAQVRSAPASPSPTATATTAKCA
jgi:pyruvate dehydrogenase E1 component alpha subunit